MTLAKLELWALRSLAIAAVLGGLAWWIYSKGEAHVQAKWDAQEIERKVAEGVQSAKNRLESTNRQNEVLVAEAAQRKAEVDLATYRRAHPLHGLLSGCLHTQTAGHPAGAGEGASDGTGSPAGETSGLLQPGGSPDPGDQLDALLAEADSINADYAVCLATRPKGPVVH